MPCDLSLNISVTGRPQRLLYNILKQTAKSRSKSYPKNYETKPVLGKVSVKVSLSIPASTSVDPTARKPCDWNVLFMSSQSTVHQFNWFDCLHQHHSLLNVRCYDVNWSHSAATWLDDWIIPCMNRCTGVSVKIAAECKRHCMCISTFCCTGRWNHRTIHQLTFYPSFNHELPPSGQLTSAQLWWIFTSLDLLSTQ